MEKIGREHPKLINDGGDLFKMRLPLDSQGIFYRDNALIVYILPVDSFTYNGCNSIRKNHMELYLSLAEIRDTLTAHWPGWF